MHTPRASFSLLPYAEDREEVSLLLLLPPPPQQRLAYRRGRAERGRPRGAARGTWLKRERRDPRGARGTRVAIVIRTKRIKLASVTYIAIAIKGNHLLSIMIMIAGAAGCPGGGGRRKDSSSHGRVRARQAGLIQYNIT